LVVVLLLFFALGAVIGVLAMLGKVLQQRRDIARLKRDIPGADSLADVN
jgi:lipopolysaccharide assembly protein A